MLCHAVTCPSTAHLITHINLSLTHVFESPQEDEDAKLAAAQREAEEAERKKKVGSDQIRSDQRGQIRSVAVPRNSASPLATNRHYLLLYYLLSPL